MNKKVQILITLSSFVCFIATSWSSASMIHVGVDSVKEDPLLAWCISRPLKVTAYYTPDPLQGVFFHGDYATEKKINGWNPKGASGRFTFNGMLAWPKIYPFGTTVSIPWFGVGGIYDRWSAIVTTSWRDVIDIRAGSGLQWMINALYRWSQSITWTICSGGLMNDSLGFDRSHNPQREDASKVLLWSIDMMSGNSGVTVSYLQSFLQQLQFLDSHKFTPWYFDHETELALCKRQIEYIGLDPLDPYCGYYGTNTRRAFAKLVKNGEVKLRSISPHTTAKKIKVKKKRIVKIV